MEIVEAVRNRLKELGSKDNVVAFEVSTHTAAEAAAAVGCSVEEIAKTIVFQGEADPVLVVTIGSKRIDRNSLGTSIGVRLRSVGAEYIQSRLGMTPGGVTPLLDVNALVVFDLALEGFPSVWVSAGTPNHVLKVNGATLRKLQPAALWMPVPGLD